MQLPFDLADWPPYWRERFEERAAIMEMEGRLPRDAAESLAWYDIRQQAEKESESV